MTEQTSLEEANKRIEQVVQSKATELYLSYLELDEFPRKICTLEHLETLVLTGNNFKEIPEAVHKLSRLRTLDLTGNQLSNLPEELCHLPELRQLEVASNNLEALPRALGELGNLQSLDVFGNQLLSLPDSIVYCHNLSSLRASENMISHLPDDIGKLTSLLTLDLSYNEISNLPLSFFSLIQLKELYLSANQLDLPFDLLSRFSNQPESLLKRIRDYQKEVSETLAKRQQDAQKAQVKKLKEAQLAEIIVIKMSHYKTTVSGLPFHLRWAQKNKLYHVNECLSAFDKRINDVFTLCFTLEETMRSGKMDKILSALDRQTDFNKSNQSGFISDLRAIAKTNELRSEIQINSLTYDEQIHLEASFRQPQEYERYFVLWLVLSELLEDKEIDLKSSTLPALSATFAHVISSYLHEDAHANQLANGFVRLLLDEASAQKPIVQTQP